MRTTAHPVAQFLALGTLLLGGVIWGTGELAQRAASQEAVTDARVITQLLARSVAEPALPRGLVYGKAGAVDRFDRIASRRLLVGDVVRIKIWDGTGRVVYSDKTELIDQRYTLAAEERAVLANGRSAAQVSDLSEPENRFEVSSGGLLEVYTRITSPEGVPLLFEVYYDADQLAAQRQEIFTKFWPITVGGLSLLLLLTTPLLWVLTRRLQTAARDRERLLQAAVEASDAERRRIARDLHDTVVQDLAGTSFRMSAAARQQQRADPVSSGELDQMSSAVRTSLRSLRSLLVEIYPPDLQGGNLLSALEDLLAPAAGAGVRTRVEVDDLGQVPQETVAVVWRVAQEAIRNAVRHARPARISVRVSTDRERICLDVVDDGVGFDPDQVDRGAHFGLRGLRDLVRETGGRLDVRSRLGGGTVVRLEVSPC